MTDQKSPVAIVTGASSGVGLYATLALVARGWHVVMACRDLIKAHKAAASLGIATERVAQVVADSGFELSGQHWSWGSRQKSGTAAFAQPLSAEATNLALSAELWALTEKMVGLA